MLMKCRVCKKNYKSNEWKNTGNLNGLCSKKCKQEHKKRCSPSHLNKLVTELNQIEKEDHNTKVIRRLK